MNETDKALINNLDPRFRELSDAALPSLVVPPDDRQTEMCTRCRTYTDRSSGICWNCAQNQQKLGIPAVQLDMVSLYQKPSQLRDWLTQYKGRTDGSEPRVEEYVETVAALLARFFYEYGETMWERRPFDVVTVVPSSNRPAPHPLQSILKSLPLEIPIEVLLERGPGELDFNKPCRDAFVGVGGRIEQRVLLIDDVFTTGARINSAAYALQAAGHELAGAMIIARRVNVNDYGNSRGFWAQRERETFSWQSSPIVNT